MRTACAAIAILLALTAGAARAEESPEGALWFLIFLYGTGASQPLPMHNFGACITAATAMSEHLSTSIACLSPDTGEFVILTNGVTEPHPSGLNE